MQHNIIQQAWKLSRVKLYQHTSSEKTFPKRNHPTTQLRAMEHPTANDLRMLPAYLNATDTMSPPSAPRMIVAASHLSHSEKSSQRHHIWFSGYDLHLLKPENTAGCPSDRSVFPSTTAAVAIQRAILHPQPPSLVYRPYLPPTHPGSPNSFLAPAAMGNEKMAICTLRTHREEERESSLSSLQSRAVASQVIKNTR